MDRTEGCAVTPRSKITDKTAGSDFGEFSRAEAGRYGMPQTLATPAAINRALGELMPEDRPVE